MSRADDTNNPDEPFQPECWISAAETIARVRRATLSSTADVSIATRAFAGLLRTNAAMLIVKSERYENTPVPAQFWWAKGYAALKQNWPLGDFETSVDGIGRVQAFGVRFHREDVDEMLAAQSSFSRTPVPAPTPVAREAGGRPMSERWPEWVAELVAVIHEEGLPDNPGVDELINKVSDQLALRGLEGPSRTTLQDTVRAVIRRMNSAGN